LSSKNLDGDLMVKKNPLIVEKKLFWSYYDQLSIDKGTF